MKTEYQFKSNELESQLKHCEKNGITELSVHDEAISNDKGKLLHFLKAVEKDAPNLFVSLTVNPSVLDNDVCRQCQKINVSLDVPFTAKTSSVLKFSVGAKDSGANALFFDKKFYSRRAETLNNAGLVFGIDLYYADQKGDSLKSFKDRLDFSIEQYPNHINFPQVEDVQLAQSAHVEQTFSAEDIRAARNISFACKTFYSEGRAVPWFNSILKALKITPSNFFSDFAEWQHCNNCDFNSGFDPAAVSHHEIEKMQLLFLQQKFEEKHKSHMFTAASDFVCLNGALSRLVSDGTESVLETEYNPEDIFGPEAMDLSSFVNDLCMEHCTVKVFFNEYGEPDFKIL